MGRAAREYDAGAYARQQPEEPLQGQLALFPGPTPVVRLNCCPPNAGCQGSGLLLDNDGVMDYCTCPAGAALRRKEVG